MKSSIAMAVLFATLSLGVLSHTSWAQEEAPSATASEVTEEASETAEEVAEEASETADAAKDALEESVKQASQKVEEISKQVDSSEQAKEISAGILQPIYMLAEHMAFPTFHWVAFTLMATGVVSFALQLVLGKLAVLAKFGFSLSEILADVLGLLISLIGLVLTTQAAAENSTFTTSAFAVLSATAVGVIAGFVFYRWGQRHELDALKGRQVAQKRS